MAGGLAGARNKSQIKPTTAEVKASAIQEKLATNKHDQRPFERGDAADLDDLVHFAGAIGGKRQAAAEYDDPRHNRRTGNGGKSACGLGAD